MGCTLLEEVKAEIEAVAPILMSNVCMLHFDGASNIRGFRVGMIFTNLDGIIMEQALHFSLESPTIRQSMKYSW